MPATNHYCLEISRVFSLRLISKMPMDVTLKTDSPFSGIRKLAALLDLCVTNTRLKAFYVSGPCDFWFLYNIANMLEVRPRFLFLCWNRFHGLVIPGSTSPLAELFSAATAAPCEPDRVDILREARPAAGTSSLTPAPCEPEREGIHRGKEPAALLEPDCVLLPIEEALTAIVLEPERLVNLKDVEPALLVAPALPVLRPL